MPGPEEENEFEARLVGVMRFGMDDLEGRFADGRRNAAALGEMLDQAVTTYRITEMDCHSRVLLLSIGRLRHPE